MFFASSTPRDTPSTVLRRSPTVLLTLAALAATVVAAYGCTLAPANCSTGQGVSREGGQDMEPGGDCIGCHSQGEGPDYLIAGTVMGKANDDTECAGVSGVTVEITDAKGVVLSLPTTSDGNFFYGGGGRRSSVSVQGIAFPYNAKVVRNGVERQMVAAQSDGDCAHCHTAQGANGAPGRILAP